ncbi:hypothetical protein [Nonomuraea rubra]|uniref:DUF317 domain-containing protein n=2 Tax=Nonomuraea rubra TaxID=46180 RepID=A0A7X0P1J5_9ACTN|nr:hypothetical protein [Nonomuraea rubra]MBB6553326.1 hypothetical protein [Nonomuraea rubra]
MAPTMAADDITVDAAHLRGLAAYGPGWALMWDEHDVFAAPTHLADHGDIFEIIDHAGYTAIHDQHAQHGQPDGPAAIAVTVAAVITGQARIRLRQWPHTAHMMAATGPYTTALRPYGIHRHQASRPDADGRHITTDYRITRTGATASITMPYATDSTVPITITITDPHPAHSVPTYTVTVPRQTPPAAVAALIAAAGGLPPHTATGYRHAHDTGFPETPRYITVEPADVRALAAHGPGWALMWHDDHTQPVITRHDRDDDALLEICTHEHMINLGSHHPDYDAIAAYLTDTLGDFDPGQDNTTATTDATRPADMNDTHAPA